MDKKGLSEITKSITDLIMPFVFMFGLYLLFFGHLSPGGGFAAGVILAGVFILITLAFGKGGVEIYINRERSHLFEAAGALLFLFVACSGIFTGKGFFTNVLHQEFGSRYFRFLSGGNIVLYNIGIALKVMAGLFMVFFILSVTRVVLEGTKLKMRRRK
ncbi:MAG TPA: MnhB domain-containing protein [bacterium]|nr:MnhB domain-containing protein [bacterium]